MQDLVATITKNLGIDAGIVEKAIGIILKMLKENGLDEKVGPILDMLPGAEDLINQAPAADQNSGGGGLMAAVGGLMGGSGTGGIMAAVGQLQGLGLDIPQSQGIAKQLIEYTKEKAGADTVSDALKDIPGIDMVL